VEDITLAIHPSVEDTHIVDPLLLIGAALGAVALLTLPTLTAMGARRRGLRVYESLLAGVFFPLTWAVWYLQDEHPYRRSRHQA